MRPRLEGANHEHVVAAVPGDALLRREQVGEPDEVHRARPSRLVCERSIGVGRLARSIGGMLGCTAMLLATCGPMKMACVVLPEITFRSAELVPPIVLFGEMTLTPRWLATALVPPRFVPT